MLTVLWQVKKAMTMTEKILARHSDNTHVAPGQNIWTNVDKLMTHDVCGPGTFGIFQREFGENAQVHCLWNMVIRQERALFNVHPCDHALHGLPGVGPGEDCHHSRSLHIHI